MILIFHNIRVAVDTPKFELYLHSFRHNSHQYSRELKVITDEARISFTKIIISIAFVEYVGWRTFVVGHRARLFHHCLTDLKLCSWCTEDGIHPMCPKSCFLITDCFLFCDKSVKELAKEVSNGESRVQRLLRH